MIRIDFLAEHPETIPVLSSWFQAQWSEYYGLRTLEDIAQDFRAESKRHELPIRLVAFENSELVGTISLREAATRNLPDHCPGLGGLLVPRQFRGHGIGTELVRAGMSLTQKLGYDKVFATTVNARGILERLDWQLVEKVQHGNEQLWLYQRDLNETVETADSV